MNNVTIFPKCPKCDERLLNFDRVNYNKCKKCGSAYTVTTETRHTAVLADIQQLLRLPEEGTVRLVGYDVPSGIKDHDARPDRQYYSYDKSVKKCVYRKDYPGDDDPNIGMEVVVYKLQKSYAYAVVVRQRSYRGHWDEVIEVSGKKNAIKRAMDQEV